MGRIKEILQAYRTELASVIRNEYKAVFTDGGVLLVMVLAIFIYSTLYASAYAPEVLRNVPIGVIDESQTPSSRELIRTFDAGPNTYVAYEPSGMEEAEELFFARKIYGVVYIPQDYEKQLLGGSSAADAAAEPTARQLRELIFRSQELLADHPVNRARRAAGKQPATSIWPWSPGYRPRMQTLQERYAPIRNGSVISAVDLIRGIGVCAGLTPVEVEGATGLYDTNYEGKAEAALRALRDEDFVFLHIEASDEAGHEGDAELKVRTIEALDARVVRPIFEAVSAWECPVSLAILPDHPTPCLLRTHTAAPVPFTIWRSGCHPDMVGAYDEQSARRGRYGHLRGDAFIDLFIHGTE